VSPDEVMHRNGQAMARAACVSLRSVRRICSATASTVPDAARQGCRRLAFIAHALGVMGLSVPSTHSAVVGRVVRR
jgi:hypothetical protein